VRKIFEVLDLSKRVLDLATAMIKFMVELDRYLLMYLRYIEALQL
jgi:hypothetical protein